MYKNIAEESTNGDEVYKIYEKIRELGDIQLAESILEKKKKYFNMVRNFVQRLYEDKEYDKAMKFFLMIDSDMDKAQEIDTFYNSYHCSESDTEFVMNLIEKIKTDEDKFWILQKVLTDKVNKKEYDFINKIYRNNTDKSNNTGISSSISKMLANISEYKYKNGNIDRSIKLFSQSLDEANKIENRMYKVDTLFYIQKILENMQLGIEKIALIDKLIEAYGNGD